MDDPIAAWLNPPNSAVVGRILEKLNHLGYT
jgi:hypothetical protein